MRVHLRFNPRPRSLHSRVAVVCVAAFCPTVTFLTSYLGPYTGTCIAPPNPGGSGTG
jgi:hypothetical protein